MVRGLFMKVTGPGTVLFTGTGIEEDDDRFGRDDCSRPLARERVVRGWLTVGVLHVEGSLMGQVVGGELGSYRNRDISFWEFTVYVSVKKKVETRRGFRWETLNELDNK